MVSFCIDFVDDLTMEPFVAAPAVLNWFFVFLLDRSYESVALDAFP